MINDPNARTFGAGALGESLGKQLFDQMQATNEMAASYLTLGRQQFAREVIAWIQRTGTHRFGDLPIGELIALCAKEADRG